ncbi:hypothetical protein A0H76_1310 [Hepatospora eriocheir]|uniref:Uncharacterized protein n=1 Tax=Hepatospora eriocheir TaxID=1081669 RepID=A0A1X0QKY3_9MICR|nr:hypothetical protein A0H76_1310 [Hepatospora eriocheir]
MNFKKSNFGKDKVTYLGCIISSNGIKPDVTRVEGFLERLPSYGKIIRTNLKKIIGFIEWFRPFVPRLSHMITSLNDKLRKDGELK